MGNEVECQWSGDWCGPTSVGELVEEGMCNAFTKLNMIGDRPFDPIGLGRRREIGYVGSALTEVC